MFMTGILCTVCGAQVYLQLYYTSSLNIAKIFEPIPDEPISFMGSTNNTLWFYIFFIVSIKLLSCVSGVSVAFYIDI